MNWQRGSTLWRSLFCLCSTHKRPAMAHPWPGVSFGWKQHPLLGAQPGRERLIVIMGIYSKERQRTCSRPAWSMQFKGTRAGAPAPPQSPEQTNSSGQPKKSLDSLAFRVPFGEKPLELSTGKLRRLGCRLSPNVGGLLFQMRVPKFA
jgi:hypothetical protein